MMKFELVSIALVLSFIMNIGQYSLNDFIDKANQELKIESWEAKLDYNKLQLEFQEYDNFTKAMTEVGKMPYNRETFNCYDHSQALVEALGRNGIASSIMINEERSHSWVVAWIDSVSGEFIEPNNPFVILEVRDDNLRVVCDAYGTVSGRDIIK